MKYISGGELLVDCLREHNVRHIFSIIGGQMGTIYDTVGRRSDIEIVVPRNEISAPLMAAGYIAASAKPAVSMATVGAGVVYEAGGLTHAWLNYIPVISIAPQVQSWKMKPHQESLQSCNQDEIFAPITKWNAIVYHRERIPQLVNRAFREAYTGAPGPVHLDMPVDVLFERKLTGRRKSRQQLAHPPLAPALPGESAALAAAAAQLSASGRGLVLVGQGIGRRGRFPEIVPLLNQLGLPVLTSRFSAGTVPQQHPVSAGEALLYSGTEAGLALINQADAVLVLGADSEIVEILERCPGGKNRLLLQVETCARDFLAETDHPLLADPLSALEQLVGLTPGLAEKTRPWLKAFIKEGTPAAAPEWEQLSTALQRASGENSIFVADGDTAGQCAARLLRDKRYRDLFMLSEKDLLGAGLPFALGTALADPGNRVTLICNHSALFAHIRELSPAKALGLNLQIIVIDDGDTAPFSVDTAATLEGFGCQTMSPANAGKTSGLRAVLIGNSGDVVPQTYTG